MPVAADGIGFKVDRLKEHCYFHWKFQFKKSLIGKNLWDIVNSKHAVI